MWIKRKIEDLKRNIGYIRDIANLYKEDFGRMKELQHAVGDVSKGVPHFLPHMDGGVLSHLGEGSHLDYLEQFCDGLTWMEDKLSPLTNPLKRKRNKKKSEILSTAHALMTETRFVKGFTPRVAKAVDPEKLPLLEEKRAKDKELVRNIEEGLRRSKSRKERKELREKLLLAKGQKLANYLTVLAIKKAR